MSSISPLGYTKASVLKNYHLKSHCFSKKESNLVAQLSDNAKLEIEKLRTSNSKYKQLDDSVLFGIYTSRKAVKQAGWKSTDNFGINIGSSRGATGLFEKYHQSFLSENKAETLSSPTTTLGNISSWIAHDLQTKGPEISHSITCSTALHALLNGIAWLNSGMCNKFLVGGSEAPLTPFTIAQMKALKIYSSAQLNIDSYPCQALNLDKSKNSMILGEGAAVACLETGNPKNKIANITGFGYATELLEHNASLSTDADCFQNSMLMAIGNKNPEDIDVIVTHTPGTVKGDTAEFNAIKNIFKASLPPLTNNKWKLGHTLGASGLLSLEMAILMLQHQEFFSVPYIGYNTPKHIKNIMVNAVGFGGNAVSILISEI